MGKIENLNEYIRQCDEVIISGNNELAKQLQKMIVGIYNTEINNIKNELDSGWFSNPPGEVNYIGNIEILKSKLINYRDNLDFEEKRRTDELEVAKRKSLQFNVSQTNENHNINTNTAHTSVTIEQTIEMVNDIDDAILNDEDKELLIGKLASIDQLKKSGKDKQTVWNKAKGVLAWIADKSIDVGIAALPYILQAIQGL